MPRKSKKKKQALWITPKKPYNPDDPIQRMFNQTSPVRKK